MGNVFELKIADPHTALLSRQAGLVLKMMLPAVMEQQPHADYNQQNRHERVHSLPSKRPPKIQKRPCIPATMIPPKVCAVLTRWGEGLQSLEPVDDEHQLGPDSDEWDAFRHLQDTRAVDSFAHYLLPFVRRAFGDEFGILTARLVGGASFRIVFADQARQLALFNRIDVAGLQINAHAILSMDQGISTKAPG
jgi:hypothetical protein